MLLSISISHKHTRTHTHTHTHTQRRQEQASVATKRYQTGRTEAGVELHSVVRFIMLSYAFSRPLSSCDQQLITRKHRCSLWKCFNQISLVNGQLIRAVIKLQVVVQIRKTFCLTWITASTAAVHVNVWKYRGRVGLYSDQIRWGKCRSSHSSEWGLVVFAAVWAAAQLFHRSWLYYAAAANRIKGPSYRNWLLPVDWGKNRGYNLTSHNGPCYVN